MKKSFITEQMYIRLFELGLPIALIARVLNVSMGLVNNNFDKISKLRDFQKTPLRLKETRLELFKMYAWFLADPIEYEQQNQGTAVSIKKVLHDYLGLESCIAYCQAVLQSVDHYAMPVVDESVNPGFRNFIIEHSDVFRQKFSDGAYSKNTGEDLLYSCMVAMHQELIPFPDEKDFVGAHSILQSTLKIMVLDKARTQTSVFINDFLYGYLEEIMTKKDDEGWGLLRMFYGISQVNKSSHEGLAEDCGKSIDYVKRHIAKTTESVLEIIQTWQDFGMYFSTVQMEKEFTLQNSELKESHLTTASDTLTMFLVIKKVLRKFKRQESITEKDFELAPSNIDSTVKYLQKLVTPIEDLDLSVRAFNCLKTLGVAKLWQIVQLDKEDLTKGKTRNLGKKQ